MKAGTHAASCITGNHHRNAFDGMRLGDRAIRMREDQAVVEQRAVALLDRRDFVEKFAPRDHALGREPRDLLLIAQLRIIRPRSEEHTPELQSLMRSSYAVFCLNKK